MQANMKTHALIRLNDIAQLISILAMAKQAITEQHYDSAYICVENVHEFLKATANPEEPLP